jgi:hypothetical protein
MEIFGTLINTAGYSQWKLYFINHTALYPFQLLILTTPFLLDTHLDASTYRYAGR